MPQFKTIVSTSFPVSQLELVQAVKDGWDIDENNLPVQSMFLFEVFLIKHDSAEMTLLKEAAFGADVPPTKRMGRPPKQAPSVNTEQ